MAMTTALMLPRTSDGITARDVQVFFPQPQIILCRHNGSFLSSSCSTIRAIAEPGLVTVDSSLILLKRVTRKFFEFFDLVRQDRLDSSPASSRCCCETPNVCFHFFQGQELHHQWSHKCRYTTWNEAHNSPNTDKKTGHRSPQRCQHSDTLPVCRQALVVTTRPKQTCNM
jgi:hypothetical protein